MVRAKLNLLNFQDAKKFNRYDLWKEYLKHYNNIEFDFFGNIMYNDSSNRIEFKATLYRIKYDELVYIHYEPKHKEQLDDYTKYSKVEKLTNPYEIQDYLNKVVIHYNSYDQNKEKLIMKNTKHFFNTKG
jgi:hypothetical protein